MAFEKKEDAVKASMSSEMLKSCKSEIAKFGFEPRQIEAFLVSVIAQRDHHTVMKYPNEEAETYRQRYVKKHEKSLGDSMVFDELAKIRSKKDGDMTDTGYFCPRMFWQKVLNTKS